MRLVQIPTGWSFKRVNPYWVMFGDVLIRNESAARALHFAVVEDVCSDVVRRNNKDPRKVIRGRLAHAISTHKMWDLTTDPKRTHGDPDACVQNFIGIGVLLRKPIRVDLEAADAWLAAALLLLAGDS